MSYDSYIFDLDGTLLNTLNDLAASCNYALRSYGMPERTVEEVRRFVGNGVRLLMVRAIPDGDNNPMPHSASIIYIILLIQLLLTMESRN